MKIHRFTPQRCDSYREAAIRKIGISSAMDHACAGQVVLEWVEVRRNASFEFFLAYRSIRLHDRVSGKWPDH